MSAKGTGSASPISLPKGGGAIQGIGETFSPDLHTGTGNFTVPIALPQGRNGFQPQIGLAYSTGNGNGPFGLGWAMSVPGVTRKTAKGVPRYDDARDTFVLSGAEDLVPVYGGGPGGQRYRPRTEGLFARITHYHGDGGDYWVVESKDGLVSRYGSDWSAGLPAGEPDPAAVVDPVNPRRVFAWRLTETTDPVGNRIEYRYERDQSPVDGPHRWDQLYLSEIRYVDYGDPADPKYLVHVRFTYEDRPDPFSDYRSGFEVRSVRRCTAIAVSTAPDIGPELAVRTYRLVYLDQRPGPPQPLPANGVSLLSLVRTIGHDGERSEELPSLEFGYSAFEPKRRRYGAFAAPGGTIPDASLGHPEYDLVDLFANGLPSVLQMNGVVRYWRNLGGGRFDRPRAMAAAPAGVHLADPGVQLVDADGDGRTDLLVTDGNRGGYFPLAGDGGWDRAGYVPYRRVPNIGLEDPTVRLVDLDGDGITDALRTGTHLELFFNEGTAGWGRTEVRARRAAEVFPDVDFADPRVKLADINGDGLQDIVLVQDGRIDYWPSLGHGFWGRRVTMRGSPRFGDPGAAGYALGYDPQRLLLADVDGDGVADLVYVGPGSVKVWIGCSGNGWSEPITIRGTPPITNRDAVRVADMHGTGTAGILWTYDLGTQRESTYKFLDLTGGRKPYLLTSMDNHRGAITRVAYASSMDFYLADEADPATRWRTRLPFPVQVVARVEVVDRLSGGKLTTEFRYHHGYWDGVEREFRGFGLVEQVDTETFDAYHAGLDDPDRPFVPVAAAAFSPPVLTRTWFHQGPVGNEGDWTVPSLAGSPWAGDPPALDQLSTSATFLATLPRRVRRDAVRSLRGQVLRTEVYALDGSERQDRPYAVTEHAYGLREEDPPGPRESDRLHIFFPHPLAKRSTDWERGADPKTHVEVTGDYDEHGLARSRTTVAVPRGRAYRLSAATGGAPYLVTRSETRFARQARGGRFVVDRPASATTYEIANDGSLALPDLIVAVARGDLTRSVIGQALSFYDGPAFEGLELGAVGDHGLLVRTESLVFTPALLQEAYGEMTATGVPPYLEANAPPAWTAEYPEEFRQRLPALAGYRYRPAGVDSVEGLFVVTERRRYDVHDAPRPGLRPRGLLKESRDALGNGLLLAHDRYDLLPTESTDAAGLTTTAVYDDRLLLPRDITDANWSRTRHTYSPLGLVTGIAVIGRDGEGDTAERPGVAFAYDLRAFDERQQPVSVRSVRRVFHANDPAAPEASRDETITSVEYSDGFGRLLQARTQAEDVVFGSGVLGDSGLPDDPSLGSGEAVGTTVADGPRVVVTGWQVYDNKGRVVERYEPFFATGFAYELPPPTTLARLRKVVTFLDPRGQVARVVNPDGSTQQFIRGVPGTIATPDLSGPERYEPTPWELFTYDANDNAGRTHGGTAPTDPTHWNTPISVTVDALGRAVETVARNGPNPATDWHVTRNAYDIRGNVLSIVDPLGRRAVATTYDLANQPVKTSLLDAGTQRTVFDAAGRAVEERDARGALVLRTYDPLGRPTMVWARDNGGGPVGLRDRFAYGDDPTGDRIAARAAYRLGRLWRQYDEAGLVEFGRYDFKGNALERSRRVIRNEAVLAVFDGAAANDWRVAPFRVDWQPATGQSAESRAEALLDAAPHETSSAFDALNRLTELRYPVDATGMRRVLRPRYNRGGALSRVELEGAPDEVVGVDLIAYNAKGQRLLAVYGNGLMTRYAYDGRTTRLVRLRTDRYTTPAAHAYRPSGEPLQDYGYAHDLAGNLIALRDRTPSSGVGATPDVLDRRFVYDPLYRLLSATGRECDAPPPPPPWTDVPRCHDVNRSRPYTETYRYDPAGNLVQLKHLGSVTGFTRTFSLPGAGNRLAALTIGTDVYGFDYDAAGNMIQEASARHFGWDHADRLRTFRIQTRAPGSQPAEDRWSEPSVYAHYLYDAAGQRVKKLVRKQGGAVEVVTWIDGLFEVRGEGRPGAIVENRTLQVMDGAKRIAELRTGPALTGEVRPALTYELTDHLGSANVVVDRTGTVIDREEHTPYGETSFGSFAKKRYRFTGKERDEESGLSYHGARYFAPWLARWTSCDPAGIGDGLNVFAYAGGNPYRLVDPTGTTGEPPQLHLIQQTELRQPVTATAVGPGFGQKLRETYQNLGAQWGMDNIQVGHPENMPFALTPAGTTTSVYPQDASENMSLGASEERARVQEARANGRFVREKGVDPTATKGTRYGQPELVEKLRDVRAPTKGTSPKPSAPQVDLPATSKTAATPVKAPEQFSFDFDAPKAAVPDAVPKATNIPWGSRLTNMGAGVLEIVVKKGGKVIPAVGTGVGVGLAANEFRKGNIAAGIVEAAGASEIPIVAQVADIGSLAADLTWVVKDALDPGNTIEDWWYQNVLR